MESFKEKLPMIILAIVFIIVLIGGYYLLFVKEFVYYTQIDNTKVTELPASEDMRYEYTLIAYNEHGKEKEMTFKTSRELREDAYLKLDTMFLRGVINWEEVQFEELPNEVKSNYQ